MLADRPRRLIAETLVVRVEQTPLLTIHVVLYVLGKPLGLPLVAGARLAVPFPIRTRPRIELLADLLSLEHACHGQAPFSRLST